ncbi:uncharacterized protein LOC105428277 isoform X2 [Pogonomyrmex barbatus]|uniref:Uncharacterized protein LOC105428277 isoform X2 n=1 Tax=Pogonomyrmex barbatus TaxID=144034 RepID=A0A6I9WHN4_9HYME|nr:uncharacterized protein LOC105428277 isoform X2 [Pogonomyrmex barbatus]
MNHEANVNYEDRIKFTIALMTKDYVKACDIGDRSPEEYERSSLIESVCEHEGSDVTDTGDDTDFIDGDADIRIDPMVANDTVSRDTSRLNNDKGKSRFDLKQKMHRVIPIKVNKQVKQITAKGFTSC